MSPTNLISTSSARSSAFRQTSPLKPSKADRVSAIYHIIKSISRACLVRSAMAPPPLAVNDTGITIVYEPPDASRAIVE